MPERPAQADPARGLTARLPLKLITPTALVLPVVLVVSVIGAVVYVQGRAAAETLERRGVEQVHGRIADRLESLLDGPRRWHELVRRQIEAGVLDPDDLRSWRLSVYRQRHAFDPALAGVTWGDDTGRTFWVFRYPGKPYWELGILDAETDGLLEEVPLTEAGELIEAGARVSAFDPRTRPWYQLGVAAGPAGAWGEPYAWVAGDVGAVGGARTLGLPFAASVLDDDGGFLGVLDTELSLIDLSAFLGRLPIGRTGLAVITDRRGRLIATSSGAALADEQLNRAAALASEDPDVRAMQRRLDAALAENGGDLAGGWTGPVTLDRGVALMSVTRFKRPGGLDWRVMTAVPVADFTAEVNAIRRDGLRLVAVAVGVTLLLGMGLAAWMVRPLLRLRDHAQRVGGGDLDTPIHLREARELVELSGELNRMTDGLRDRLALRKSLRRASDVQRALLPTADPHLPGFDLVGHCDYCDETGGDYYDFLPDAETHEAGGGVVIGDVMGHGIA
ncbi:MAG: HAMP domain-containing protein, partial [Planctomycetota bacterium]